MKSEAEEKWRVICDKQRKTTDRHHSVIDLTQHTDRVSEDKDHDYSSWNQIGYVHISQKYR